MPKKNPQEGQGKRHPIQVVVRRTGLSADVLRAWEKRYGVVDPERSDGGRRLYSDDDIDLLRLLKRATDGGRSIGQVADLSATDLADLVRQDEVQAPAPRAVEPGDEQRVVDGALGDIEALDARALQERLRRAMVDLPATTFLDRVVTPLLSAIGARWEQGTLRPSHEHLASAVLLRVLNQFLAAVAAPPGGRVLVAGTPQGVRHEFGALLAAASAAIAGWDVVYLGADLPAEELAAAAKHRRAEVVALSVVPPLDRAQVVRELQACRKALPRSTSLMVGGAASPEFAAELDRLGAAHVQDLQALRAALA